MFSTDVIILLYCMNLLYYDFKKIRKKKSKK